MGEREPRSEVVQGGDFLYLYHLGTENVLLGYCPTSLDDCNDLPVGLLIANRPHPAGPR